MPYDEGLARRVEEILGDLPELEIKKMFGGVGYMVRGNMACGVHGEHLIVRLGLEGYEEALASPHTKVFDITGRPMKGWVMVAADGYESDAELSRWVHKGVEFALTLPAK